MHHQKQPGKAPHIERAAGKLNSPHNSCSSNSKRKAMMKVVGKTASSATAVVGGGATTTTTADMPDGSCCFFGGLASATTTAGNNNNNYLYSHHQPSYYPQKPSHILSTPSTSTTSYSLSTSTNSSRSNSNSDNNNDISYLDDLNNDTIDDAELAKELNELSMEERERVYDDIHGCTQIPIESKEFIQTKIDNFNKCINELPRTKRQALDRAIFLKPSIESDIQFKLMFLRADNYDCLKASRRIAKYFTDKLNLFGEEKLVKTITLIDDDFNKDDMDLFLKGPCIFHPQRDNVGRPIWLSNVSCFEFTQSLDRVAWYMIMTSLEDEAAQLQGVCNVILCPDKFTFPLDGGGAKKIYERMVDGGHMLANLPARVSSQHFCYTSSSLEFMLRAFRAAYGKHQRLRMRAHFGSKVEIQYSLLTYGISCPFITHHDDEHEKQVIHQAWIQKRIEIEKSNLDKQRKEEDATGIIIYPQPNDVLVGRGCPYQTYCGNVNLSSIVSEKFLEKYCNVIDRFEKTCIHMDVVKYIKETVGGRFLERCKDNSGWIVVDDKVARKKVNSSFRSKIAKLNNNNTSNNKNKTEQEKQRRQRDATTTMTTTNNTPTTPPSSLLLSPTSTTSSQFGGFPSSTNSSNNNSNLVDTTTTMQFTTTLFSNNNNDSSGIINNNNGGGYGGGNDMNNNTNKRLRYDPSLLA